MNVTVSLPEEFASRFGAGPERDRHVLEALAVGEYRSGALSRSELQQLLAFSQEQLAAFLGEPPAAADADADLLAIRSRLQAEDDETRGEAARDLTERFRAFAKEYGPRLRDLDVAALIGEGRR